MTRKKFSARLWISVWQNQEGFGLGRCATKCNRQRLHGMMKVRGRPDTSGSHAIFRNRDRAGINGAELGLQRRIGFA